LRHEASNVEQWLWQLLRDRRLGGFKFRRQHPLPPYTLDFYCDAAKLGVELDGGQHADEAARDARRDAFLRERGIRTLRVWNNEIFGNLEGVLEAIWAALHEAQHSSGAARHLLPEGEGNSKHRAAIQTAAQAVLDARAQFPDATLADLYDPLTMPPALVKAHAALDKAVDAAYLGAEKAAGRKAPRLTTDAERVAFLFERYQQLTSLLSEPAKPARGRRGW
jgi:very-short-patch-repair endonuclease